MPYNSGQQRSKHMSFQATSKQQAYFRSLTGEYLPRGTGKSKASAMIKKALAGEITRKPDVVTVYGWRFDAVTLRHMTPEMQTVKYAVDQNYRQVNGNFA